jgi:hypothetical protein
MKSTLTTLALLICSLCFAQQTAPSSHRLADSMQQKINYIEQNAQAAHPNQAPVVISEDEVNDYFADGRVKLPQGVKKVTFKGQSGIVTTMAVVDFDEIRQGQQSSNPMLSVFKGTNDVTIESDAVGAGGKGKVHVRTVTLNGVEVPQFALQYFVDKYIKPKYPNLGIDSEFQLPDKIDTATVGYHKVTITQK